MASSLDLLTHGLQQMSGLSLTTEGLLVVEDVDLETIAGAELRVDARMFDTETLEADLLLENGDLAPELTLRTAVMVSLFSDRRGTREELERFGDSDPRGWWGDLLAPVEGDAWGSKLWLLEREKQTDETLNRAREYSSEALRWLREDGIAERVNVEAAWMDRLDPSFPRGFLGLGISIQKPEQPNERFAFVWSL